MIFPCSARRRSGAESFDTVYRFYRQYLDDALAPPRSFAAAFAAQCRGGPGVPADKVATEVANSKFPTMLELEASAADGTAGGRFSTLNAMFKDFGRLPEPLDPKADCRADLYKAG